MSDETATAATVSSGMEALIQRLRDEGVGGGRAQAEKIINDADARAEWTIAQAEEEAQRILNKARDAAARLETAGREALNVAARDAVLTLKTQLTQRFTREVRRLVGKELEKKELLQKLILEVAGRVREETADADAVEVLLPRNVLGLEELSRNPEELEKGKLTRFIRLINVDLLREGISFGVAKDDRGGLRLRLKDQGITLDLSDEAIAAVLLEHLQPRFRALLEGIVK